MANPCPMCSDFSAPTARLLLSHIGSVHAHSPNFKYTCGIPNCQRTLKSYSAMKKHFQRKHGGISTAASRISQETMTHQAADLSGAGQGYDGSAGDEDTMHTDPPVSSASSGACRTTEEIQKSFKYRSARWIIKLKEERKLTQSVVNDILADVTELCTDIVCDLRACVEAELEALDMNIEHDVPRLKEVFDDSFCYSRPFQGLESSYLQLSYYKEQFQMIEPTEIELGRRKKYKGTGSSRHLTEKIDGFQYIPLIPLLERLLKNKSIFKQVKSSHKRSDGYIEDYIDAKMAAKHPLLSANMFSLHLIVYYDELEVCNPLGSARKKHKLGMFYFTIGNIHPKQRSGLKSIYLLAICKTTMIKEYGIGAILNHIVDDVCTLEQGVEMNTYEGMVKVYGTIVSFSADNLGSHAVGGFKESGNALRPCRHCLITREDLPNKLKEKTLDLRTPNNYDHMCHILSISGDSTDTTTYGINRPSELNRLQYYHVCDYGLPPDIMHDLLEGYLPYTVKLMLSHCIHDPDVKLSMQLNFMSKIFSCKNFPHYKANLIRQATKEKNCFNNFHHFNDVAAMTKIFIQVINTAIENFEYGINSIKPPTLTENALSVKSGCSTTFPMSASETWCFARHLPQMIGHLISPTSSHWQHFLELLDIVDMACAPVIDENTAPTLQVMVESNLCTFTEIYPTATVIPKMHYLLHMGRYIENMGPLVRHWTMRFESKHQYFKRLSMSMGNYINLPYSLALRHQCYQSYLLDNDNILTCDSVETGPGKAIHLETSKYKDELSQACGRTNGDIFCANWVNVNGQVLKEGVVVLIARDDPETDLPVFVIVDKIFVLEANKILLGSNMLDVIDYLDHYHTYAVKVTEQQTLVNYYDLCSTQVLHTSASHFLHGTVKYVTLKYALS